MTPCGYVCFLGMCCLPSWECTCTHKTHAACSSEMLITAYQSTWYDNRISKFKFSVMKNKSRQSFERCLVCRKKKIFYYYCSGMATKCFQYRLTKFKLILSPYHGIFSSYGEKKLHSYLQYWAGWCSSNAPELYWEDAWLEFQSHQPTTPTFFMDSPSPTKKTQIHIMKSFLTYQMMDSIYQITSTKCNAATRTHGNGRDLIL